MLSCNHALSMERLFAKVLEHLSTPAVALLPVFISLNMHVEVRKPRLICGKNNKWAALVVPRLMLLAQLIDHHAGVNACVVAQLTLSRVATRDSLKM